LGAESESIPLKITESRGGGERFPVTVRGHSQGSPESVIIRYDQNFFMIPHRGTEITEKKQCLRVPRGFVWDIGHTGTAALP